MPVVSVERAWTISSYKMFNCLVTKIWWDESCLSASCKTRGGSMSMPMLHIDVVLLLQAGVVGHENTSQSFLESVQWHHDIILYHLFCSTVVSTSHRTSLEGSACLPSMRKALFPGWLSGCVSHFRSCLHKKTLPDECYHWYYRLCLT